MLQFQNIKKEYAEEKVKTSSRIHEKNKKME